MDLLLILRESGGGMARIIMVLPTSVPQTSRALADFRKSTPPWRGREESHSCGSRFREGFSRKRKSLSVLKFGEASYDSILNMRVLVHLQLVMLTYLDLLVSILDSGVFFLALKLWEATFNPLDKRSFAWRPL